MNKKDEDGNMRLRRQTINQCIVLAAMMSFAMVTPTPAVWAGDNGFTLEPEFSVDSGDYGGGDTITTSAFSINGEYEFARDWTLSLTIVPYQRQNETYTDVVLVAGRPVHHVDHSGVNPHHADTHTRHENGYYRQHSLPHETDHAAPRHSDDHDQSSVNNHSQVKTRQHDDHGEHPASVEQHVNGNLMPPPQADVYPHADSAVSAAGQETATQIEQVVKRHGSASGIGDTFLDLSRRIVDETASLPGTSLHAGVKIPTADEDKGLGTGKVDYQAGVALNKEVGRWSLEGGIDYNILGEPDDYDLDNYISGYAAVATGIRPNMEVAMQLSGAQAASSESEAELALGLKLRYDIEQVGEFSAGLQKGLADGSPDYSVVVGYSISF